MAKQIGPIIPGSPLTFAKELGKFAKEHGLGAIRYASPKLRAEMSKDFGVLFPGIADGTITGAKLKSAFSRLDKKWGGYLTGIFDSLKPGKAGALARRAGTGAGIPAGAKTVAGGGTTALALRAGTAVPAGAAGAAGVAGVAGVAGASGDWMSKLLNRPVAGPIMKMGLALAASYVVIKIMDMADMGGLQREQIQFGTEMASFQAGILPGETGEQAGTAQFNARLLSLLESKYAGQGGVSSAQKFGGGLGGGFGARLNRASDDIVIGGQGGSEEADLITMLQSLGIG